MEKKRGGLILQKKRAFSARVETSFIFFIKNFSIRTSQNHKSVVSSVTLKMQIVKCNFIAHGISIVTSLQISDKQPWQDLRGVFNVLLSLTGNKLPSSLDGLNNDMNTWYTFHRHWPTAFAGKL